MPDVTKIENVKSLLQKLRLKEARSKQEDNGSVIVGYNASYAVFVHENLKAAHGAAFNIKHKSKFGKRNKKSQFLKATGTGKKRGEDQQAKFLEKPARDLNNSGELAREVRESYDKQGSLLKALLKGGLRLQRESQQIVPVFLGNLKGSAFTEVE